MLCLELSDRGYKTSDKNTGRADITVIESDQCGDQRTVTFSANDGADLKRPFDIEELVSLIASKNTAEPKAEEFYVSPTASYAVYKGNEVALTELEHKILYLLYSSMGEYITAE